MSLRRFNVPIGRRPLYVPDADKRIGPGLTVAGTLVVDPAD